MSGALGSGAARASAAPFDGARPGPRLGLAHFPDGPPARVTGGFGEDTCAACHFDWDDGSPSGGMRVEGFPDCPSGDASYDLAVVIEDPDMAVAGFQLAVRHTTDGTQAGTLAVPESQFDLVSVLDDSGLLFAQQRLRGSEIVEEGVARWRIRWTAPAGGEPVVLHAAGIAGDGDRSQAGDHVYTGELESGRAGCSR
jgi:hypothetical protein